MAATVAMIPLGAQAQQIITAVESENDALDNSSGVTPRDSKSSTIAGQAPATNFGGADARAKTDYGVNKIAARGNSDYDTYASSAWLDTYQVGGGANEMIDVSFTFSTDGSIDFGTGGDGEMNFKAYALRGSGWSMSGNGDQIPSLYGPGSAGSRYERLLLSRTTPGGIAQADMRSFEGFYNFANTNGAAGGLQSQVIYVAAGDYYSVTQPVINAAGTFSETRYYATGFRRFFQNGQPNGPFIPYAQSAGAAQARASLVANYSLLGTGQLCAGETCPTGNYPQSEFSVSFRLAGGSTFSLAAWLYADDVVEGRVDFYNTAKVSAITVSNGATLTSLSGSLVAQPGGGYGYEAALASAAPEPSAWALLIGGMGLVGTAMRRRRLATV